MPYKPKFCCQCGEKIDRIDWKPWNSRRFCELCDTDFWIYDKLSWAVVGIALVFGLFGIGIYLQKPEKQLNIAQNQFAASNARSDLVQPKPIAQVSNNSGVQASTQTANNFTQQNNPAQLAELKIKQAKTPVADTAEKVYFCGAMTKKGTMCSRRVKGGGRCWQHEGQTATLPPEKLIIQ